MAIAPRIPNLTWLRTFEAAARLQGFSAAGAELGLTQSAVSQQIRALESRLGSDLFIRSGRRLELTEIAKSYLPSVRRAIEELGFVTEGIFGPATARTVTVYAPTSIAVGWLAPRLPRFASVAPDVTVKLVTSTWSHASAGADIDLELRMMPLSGGGMAAPPLIAHSLIAVCAPAMAGDIREPADLLRPARIHVQGFDDHWSRFFSAAGITTAESPPRCIVDSTLAALEIVAAGGGVAVVVQALAETALQRGTVVQAGTHDVALATAHYLIEHPGDPVRRREVAQLRAWLNGLAPAS